MDWSHPDWRYSIKNQEDEIAFQRFLAFTDNQLKELATRYPTVKDFWFDGTWDESIKNSSLALQSTADYVPMITAKGTLTATDILWEITNQLMNVASPIL